MSSDHEKAVDTNMSSDYEKAVDTLMKDVKDLRADMKGILSALHEKAKDYVESAKESLHESGWTKSAMPPTPSGEVASEPLGILPQRSGIALLSAWRWRWAWA